MLKHLGIVDVTIYRRIYMDPEHCSLSVSSPDNNRHITGQIENAVTEINEIMRSKVSAICGNCILSYRLQILWLKEEFHYNSQAIFFAFTAIGDAVQMKVIEKDSYGEESL